MKRLIVLSLLVGAATACTDDRPSSRESSPTEPSAPLLTMATLRPGAPSVCVSSVRQRDGLLARVGAPHGVTAATKLTPAQRADLTALDEMIADVCE